MSDENNLKQDPVEELAWSWVMRQHERDTFDASAKTELLAWLEASPVHRKAYDHAGRLWLAAGLVPPVSDVVIPGADEVPAH